MKLPSLRNLANGLIHVTRRFPLELTAAFIGTVCAMLLFEQAFPEKEEQIIRMLLCSNLALTLLLSVSVFSESRQLNALSSLAFKAASVAALITVFLSLDPITDETNVFRFVFLAGAFHLLVSFAPFIFRCSMEGFWEYNKQLFIRILTAGLYSTVLYGGLAIALLSADALFDFKIRSELYGHLFALVFGLFNTTFFLAGFPANWKNLEEPQPYPKGLKIFTQYVLIPLATVYLGILLAYEAKLVIEWSLPKGLVATLVLGYAVYGMLSILLVHPVRFDKGNRWIMTFSKLFYLLLIPLIILLGSAVYLRVNQYGVTESRYVLIILSLWLTGITIYFLSSRLQNIKVIPVSLCIVVLLAVWGPQSAPAVSKRSQLNRLRSFFEQKNSTANGKLIPLTNASGSGEATEILRYLINRHGAKALHGYLLVDPDSLTRSADTLKYRYARDYERFELVRRYLNLKHTYETAEEQPYFSAEAVFSDNLPIDGYRYLYKVRFPQYQTDSSYRWQIQGTDLTFIGKSHQAKFNLQPVVELVMNKSPEKRYNILKGGELYSLDDATGTRLIMENINFQIIDGKAEIQNINGFLLFR
ncbi:MAG: DUF4153 domain-containing protein [Cyclobacteriaceae bacterium]